jgi:DNA-binding Xre family transcriptional regulator
MTKLGLYLAKRSINKSDLARKIGTTKQRIDKLTNNPNSKLLAREAYLIAMALQLDPTEFIKDVCEDLKLIE